MLGVTTYPSAETADELFDRISARLAEPDFRPRALLDRFGIELISTTDAATDDLAQHAKVAADLPGRVVPTSRPDAVVHLDRPDWADLIQQLGALADVDTSTYDGICRRSGSGGRPLWRPARGRPTTGTSVPRRFRCPMRRRRGSTRVR